jgi:hypothetical protein
VREGERERKEARERRCVTHCLLRPPVIVSLMSSTHSCAGDHLEQMHFCGRALVVVLLHRLQHHVVVDVAAVLIRYRRDVF